MTAVSPLGPAGPTAPESAAADDVFRALYEQHSSCVFGYCLRWLRSREEAEDAVQTTFLYAMRGLRRGIVPTYDEAWLFAIARNVCRTRTKVTRRRAVEIARDPQLLAESVAAPARNDDLADLSEALTGLTEAQRRAILLREWQGLSYREIAAELDLSQAAVETLLFRARRALAARLRGAGSFLPWLKSFAAGGAGSLAVGASVVAVTAAGTIAGSRPGGSVPQPAPAARSGLPVVHRGSHPTARPPLRRRAAAHAHTPAASRIDTSPAAPAVAQPRTPTETSDPQPVSDTTQTVVATTKPVVDTTAGTAQAVVASATDAVSAIEPVVPGAVATTTEAVADAANAVSASVPASSPITAGDVVPSLPPLLPGATP